ncbi:exodeoxyribonuclease V subunit gamma [Pseudoalteromonas luteoviolacea]|uniref:exodeoxyribonuclease V subunit gamma n=1 Tax=Pseudoalteromonas luteoviolacea TaxID=43657 RepID=UPI001B39C083|nr:exodeoxyribonuclease V subunit gamma [Pseudoalteromonas luteoviolacea]MBQ4835377.1 exodeoxyribonuclease V subunit gamma [Pseudoalteromonas luteoviolacea]
MLHIIQSNRMEALQAQFNTVMQTAPLSDPFQRDIVLVQSPGMSQWLKNGLSKHIGVAAQVDFPLPLSFIWRLYQQFLPDVPSESPYNKNNMAWKLFNVLPNKLAQPLYLPLSNYLYADIQEDALAGKELDGLKLFTLCEKIADVYDQYLMYRPDWLSIWESGTDQLADVDVEIASWQPDLWRSLVEYTHQLGQSSYNRANMHAQLLTALENASSEALPERIAIFGLSAMPTSQLEVFQALACKTEVLLFFFNPSEHYWGDLVDEKTQAKIHAKYAKRPEIDASLDEEQDYYNVGNPLLSSWGKLGRDYLEQLIQLDARWLDGFVEDFNDSLLSQIQNEIYQLAFKGESLQADPNWFVNEAGKLPVSEDDKSIYLQDCHTPLREVECLHDHLLNLFNQYPDLTPKDVIIMMPDVGSYSPYIEAVFGSALGKRYIPCALADMAIEQEKPVLSSFVTLVNLPFSRFGVSDILDLLAVEAISSRFELEASEFEQIKYWLDQVVIKWGLDAKNKADHGLPEMPLNTWLHGLNRLLLGVASSCEEAEFNGVYPADLVEGMAINILSKLVAFVEALDIAKLQLAKAGDLAEKSEMLRQLLGRFYHQDAEQSWDLMQLHKVIEGIEKHFENGDMRTSIEPRVLAYLVKQGIQEKGVGQRFLSGAVNFCTLMPMRAVPFKVVCLLGMNDADYPRQVQPIGFDLVPASSRRKGDRSRKLDDRYLFLEALLSARLHFYVSYIGRSCFNNEIQVPSVLVSELFEYIDRSFYCEDSKEPLSMLLKHQAPLQPFNSLHYQCGQLQSYNPNWLFLPAEEAKSSPSPLIVAPPEELELAQLLRAFTAPQSYFYQSCLGIKIAPATEYQDDTEPFALDPLTRYQYLQEILDTHIHEQALSTEQMLQRGHLPQAFVGEIQLELLEQRVLPMVAILKSKLVDASAPQEIAISVNGIKIVGWLDRLFGSEQIFYRPASIKAKDKIRAFIYHLLANATVSAMNTTIIGLDEQVTFDAIDKPSALQLLETWMVFYMQLITQPVPFFPASSYAYANTEDIGKANAKFAGGQYIGVGESEDPYVALNFKDLESCLEEFTSLSKSLLGPIIALEKEQQHGDA